jgi:Zn-dependent peptidase ImmA (M78 family)/transcriptional regulator with XRE-family HTH domain
MSNSIGANIRLARLFHGMTLEDLAVGIGKTRQYVHKIETEQISPPASVLNEIASMTQVDPVFFTRSYSASISEEHCHFRKNFSARASVKHIALAKGEMFRRLVAEVESEIKLPGNRIPQRDARSLVEIEQAAEFCRRYWGLGLGPLQSATRLAETVGAVVTSFRGLSREVDAYSISAARPIIVVNQEDSSACRLRFDVAHELGHLVLHVGKITGDRKTESEANRFAGAFLMPRSSFVKEFPRLRGIHLNWQGLAEMKLRWKVSKAAILYRAKQLSLISEDQYKTGFIRLSRGGEARGEREDHLIAREEPEIFSAAVNMVCEHRGQSLEQYAQSVGVRAAVLQEFLPSVSDADSVFVADLADSDEAAAKTNVVSLAERRLKASGSTATLTATKH